MKKIVFSAITATVLLSAASHAAPPLPDNIKAKGELSVAFMPNYPPMDYKDPATNQLTGFDYDLGSAIGKKLGVKISWQEIGFEQMLNAVKTHRIDMILSAMTDTRNRQGTLTFVDYFQTGPQFYTLTSHTDIATQQDLCGRKVGASRRTTFPAEIAKWSLDNCESAGKPAIVVKGTEGTADARTQLRQGRLDAVVQGQETVPYFMDLEKNTYKPLGKAFAVQYTGIGMDKENTQLITAVQGALNEMIADGTYQSIVKKWGQQDNRVTEAKINQGG